MKLVLQCAVCGTNHPVGTPACATCRATGVQNLRLMFECPSCFRLGLNPTCDACRPPPYEVVEEPAGPADQPYEVVEGAGDGFEFTLDEEDEPDLGDDSDAGFTIDLE